jgi:hypothetical protein
MNVTIIDFQTQSKDFLIFGNFQITIIFSFLIPYLPCFVFNVPTMGIDV